MSLDSVFPRRCVFAFHFYGFHALFSGVASTKSGKINFKIGFYGTIHIFKNYLVIVLSIFSFQFSVISDIQTDPNLERNILVGP